MFLGATKYDILSYLVGAKERIVTPDDSYTFKFSLPSTFEPTSMERITNNGNRKITNISNSINYNEIKSSEIEKCMTSIERNDSGVGSETSKTSRTKYQPTKVENKTIPPIHLCEDCGMYAYSFIFS